MKACGDLLPMQNNGKVKLKQLFQEKYPVNKQKKKVQRRLCLIEKKTNCDDN